MYLLSNYLFTANVYDVTPTSGNICQFFKIQTNEVFSNLLFQMFKMHNIQNPNIVIGGHFNIDVTSEQTKDRAQEFRVIKEEIY